MKKFFVFCRIELDHQGINGDVEHHVDKLRHEFLNKAGMTPQRSHQLVFVTNNIEVK